MPTAPQTVNTFSAGCATVLWVSFTVAMSQVARLDLSARIRVGGTRPFAGCDSVQGAASCLRTLRLPPSVFHFSVFHLSRKPENEDTVSISTVCAVPVTATVTFTVVPCASVINAPPLIESMFPALRMAA